MTNDTNTTGLILFAHGSRDALWRRPIESIAQIVAQESPDTPVACAYLELNDPNLAQACQDLLRQHPSITQINILPVFLGIGKHAREDMPELIKGLRQQHPTLTFQALPSVGESPAVLRLIAQLALQSSTACS